MAADFAAWAPLRQRAFRWLWLGVLISSVGTWMQTVGAQWLLIDAPNAPALVALVSRPTRCPWYCWRYRGGVLADSFDRRWLLFTVQVYFFSVGILLAVLTAAGQMSPALLLAFTFALGAGVAVQLPGWQATIPELVPRPSSRAVWCWPGSSRASSGGCRRPTIAVRTQPFYPVLVAIHYTVTPERQAAYHVRSTLGEDAVLYGAVELAIQATTDSAYVVS